MTKGDLLVALDMLSGERIEEFKNKLQDDEDFTKKVLSSFPSIVELVMFIETGGEI